MCLLNAALEWDERRIVCEAMSHNQPDNPLRAEGRRAQRAVSSTRPRRWRFMAVCWRPQVASPRKAT